MSWTPAATRYELVRALHGADDDFIESMLADNVTIDEARLAWMTEQAIRLERSLDRLDETTGWSVERRTRNRCNVYFE